MRQVSAREAYALMQRGHVYIDVRLSAEFATGHPAGAICVPLQAMEQGMLRDRGDFVQAVCSAFSLSTPLILGCESGVRSLRAAQLLEAAGFSEISEQRAGMGGVRDAFGQVKEPGYRAEGLPVEIGLGPPLDALRDSPT